MIRRLLVANRGEIAVRIMRACRELGIETVAVYSEPDARAAHALLADRAVAIGPAAPAESYLSIPRILEAARTVGADAIHPGYGFLSENPDFATACDQAGIVFVGPPAAVMARMGSKIEARRLMSSAGVPIVPGETPIDQSDEGVTRAANRIGFPLLVKASAGGGGKGMRRVSGAGELTDAIQAARREAIAAFDDGTLYIERLLERSRHIEIQVFADTLGHVVHLFERECSVQRRHQKVIEESPSPALSADLRASIADAAVRAARAADYVNAGTIEFLVNGDQFYFLEMNTRLQVEHPVTEFVVGVDLVHAQIQVAAGSPLPWSQDAVTERGHAIEARVYAESPARGFLPQAGPLLLYREPRMPGVHVDSGYTEGDTVPVHYDPLLAKVIATAESRSIAITRLRAALGEFPILGVETNIPFLIAILEHPRFLSGDVDTTFLDSVADDLAATTIADGIPEPVRAAFAADQRRDAHVSGPEAAWDPWSGHRNKAPA